MPGGQAGRVLRNSRARAVRVRNPMASGIRNRVPDAVLPKPRRGASGRRHGATLLSARPELRENARTDRARSAKDRRPPSLSAKDRQGVRNGIAWRLRPLHENGRLRPE